MASKKYTWVETHKSIVQYLLKNENNQHVLIDLLKSVGITGFDDQSKPGKRIDLNEIDPFTFFCFIYKHRSVKRLKLLQEIAKKLSLPIPSDDLGIPSAQAMKVWMFPFKYNRKDNEVQRLWSFFKKALKQKLTNKDFDDVLQINGTGRTKLTEGLFNIDPERYLPINGPVQPFLKEVLGINSEFKTFAEYLNILNAISKKSKKPFYQLSHEAYIWNSENGEPIIEEHDDTVKYWLYAPGKDAKYWDEFYSEGIMGLGWDRLGDLNKYNSKDAIVKELQKIDKTEGSKKNDSTANYDFCYSISVGDIVIAKKGRSDYLGYGIVSSDYFYDPTRKYYQHVRKIDWKVKGVWKEKAGPIALKTLTDITKYPDYVKKLTQLLNIDLKKNDESYHPLNVIFYGPPGTGKTFNTIIRSAEIVSKKKDLKFKEALDIFNQNLHDTIEFITFHQNYSYEDFIQGLKPDVENDKELVFERRDGIFKKLADKALKNLIESKNPKIAKRDFDEVFNEFIQPLRDGGELVVNMKKSSFKITEVTNKLIDFEKLVGTSHHTLNINTLRKMYERGKNDIISGGLASYYQPILELLLRESKIKSTESVSKRNYVLVIDEINRANISRVFGELITLIECDKRSEGNIPMNVTLPSGETFCVPSNLYIVGTMNTADKSIALLDIALRRRFEFESMYPKYELSDGTTIHETDILKKINAQIISLKGYDFQIGHSFFMADDFDLVKSMNKNVVPLLLEYFMNKVDEVVKILVAAGLKIDKEVWPIQVLGKA